MSTSTCAYPTKRRLRTAAALLVGWLLFAWAGSGLAAVQAVDYTEFSLGDLMEMNVVYGASKHMQKANEAPSSISIVTREQIQAYGWRTLAEVLTSLRGFYITYDRNFQYIGVRGLGSPGDLSSRLLVLVDGIRVNEGSIGGVLMGNGFPVDIDLIEHIEVIRGPASSLYGTNAMLGIVNVITREGYQIRAVCRASAARVPGSPPAGRPSVVSTSSSPAAGARSRAKTTTSRNSTSTATATVGSATVTRRCGAPSSVKYSTVG